MTTASLRNAKWNRNYILRLEINDDQFIEISAPLTLELQVTRNNLSSANTAHFVLYNLNPDTRNLIFKDQYDTSKFRAIQLFAGYGGTDDTNLARVFNGFIKSACSYREGQNFKTDIEAYDGYITSNSFTTVTLPAGTSSKDTIKNIMESFENIKQQVIGNNFTDTSKRGLSMVGDPMEMLQQLTNNQVYIDDQKAYAISQDEVVPSEIRLISDESGILNTPRKHETLVEVEMLFEPRLKPSQLLELKSALEPRYNGVYRVTGITHRGTISGAIGGDLKTQIQMVQMKNYTVIYDQSTNTYIAKSKT